MSADKAAFSINTIGISKAMMEKVLVDKSKTVSLDKTTNCGAYHGEKLYESLLTKEEYIKAENMEGFFWVPASKRNLNYNKFFVKGNVYLSTSEEYLSLKC